MIDFQRSLAPRTNQNLKGIRYNVVDLDEGKETDKYYGFIDNISVRPSKKQVRFEGSLHACHSNYLIEGNKGNSNDFDYYQLCSTIDYLAQRGINWNETRLTDLEFGLNIEVNRPIEEILDCIRLHKELPPKDNECNEDRCSKFFKRSDYRIKIYGKSIQYKIRDKHILRIEIRAKKKQFIKQGIKNVNDLKNIDNLKFLYGYLTARFNELVIVDDFYHRRKELGGEDYTTLIECTDANYWKYCRHTYSRTYIVKRQKELHRVIEKYGLNTTKKYLQECLDRKFSEMVEPFIGLHFPTIDISANVSSSDLLKRA